MGESAGFLPLKSQHPFIQLLVSLITLLVISTLLLVFTLGIGRLIFGPGMTHIDLAKDITPKQSLYLGFIQLMSQVSIFLVPALLISWFMTLNISEWLGSGRSVPLHIILLVLFGALAVIPLSTMAGVFNSKLSLPPGLERIEDWMIRKEGEAMKLTGHLVYASNPGRLILNLFILAIVPALSEELFFRGVLQQILQKWFRSGGLAVVITALVFSTLHLQFYGFLPRFILGLMFGYLFLWSGSIWIPVLAHMVNNSVPVIAAYFMGWNKINSNLSESLPGGVAFLLIIIALPAAVMILLKDALRNRTA